MIVIQAMKPSILFFAVLFISAPALAVDPPPVKKPTPLFNGKDLTGWTARDPKKAELWTVATDVALDPKNPKHLRFRGQPKYDKGLLVAQIKDFQGTDLITVEKFRDFTLHLEFLLPKD